MVNGVSFNYLFRLAPLVKFNLVLVIMRISILLFFLIQATYAQQTVQFAAATTEDAARQKAASVNGYVVRAVVNGKLYFRVQKKFASADEAQRIARQVGGFVTEDRREILPDPIRLPVVFPPKLANQFPPILSLPLYSQGPNEDRAYTSAIPLIESISYVLSVPPSWNKQTVTYPECTEGLLFLPKQGGAAIQVFVLGDKLRQSPNQMLVDYTVEVLSRLVGIAALATQPVEVGNRLEFDVKLRGEIMGKGVILRGEKVLLAWAVARPAEFNQYQPIIQTALSSLRVR